MNPPHEEHPDRALAQMLDVLPDRVSRYRVSDLRVLYCNRAWAAGHGASPAELVGRSLDELLTPAELEGLHAQLGRIGHDQSLLPDVVPRPAPEDPSRWVLWVDKLLPGPEGDEVLSVGRDVTESQRTEARLRESEQRFRLAMTHAPIGMAIVGLDGAFLEANPALAGLVGRTADDLVRMRWPDITHPDDVAATTAQADRLLAGEVDSVTMEQRYRHADGSIVWGELSATLVRDDHGRPRYVIAQVVDVTDRVERERVLRRVVEVERESAERLRNLDEAKNAFLSAVSHELRTPLTVVQGMAATLQRVRSSLDEATRDRLEDAILEQSERLRVLLEDLLDVDRLARGTMRAQPERFDVAARVRQVVAASSVASRVAVHAPDHLEVAADAVQVERIVVNLLENAAKYAPEGEVTVRVAALPRGGFRLEVRDRGPGIPSGELGRVFEPFHRGVPEHPQPGTGVGLALVAEFARLHGGRAWAEPADEGAHLIVEVRGAGRRD